MSRFKGKVAVVTGGNSGIGRAAAQVLIEEGATVVITGRRKEAVDEAAAALGAHGFVADQASVSDTVALCDMVARRYGKVDILFINAGITGDGGPIGEATEANFDQVMGINFRGAYFTLSKFIPLLADGASVVVLSSIVATMHKPNSSIYQASKAALNSVAKTAAAELAPRRIRVNLVSPGPTRTEILGKNGLDQAGVERLYDDLTQIIPLRKVGAAGDVARLVAYLCGDEAGFITGTEVVVDGGMTL